VEKGTGVCLEARRRQDVKTNRACSLSWGGICAMSQPSPSRFQDRVMIVSEEMICYQEEVLLNYR
jgi:hypothetical protein